MIDTIIDSFKDGKKNSLMSLGIKEFIIFKDSCDLEQVEKLGSLVVYRNRYHTYITSYSPTRAEYCIVRYYNHGGGSYE